MRKFSQSGLSRKPNIVEINISASGVLPYIELKHSNIKLLIDTGSSRSILKPTIAEKFYPHCIYREPNTIKTAIGSETTQFQAKIPAFLEFSEDYTIDFILFDFHNFFDGVIDLKDLINLQLNIDLVNKKLVGFNFAIPFKYRTPYEANFCITLNPNEKALKQIPVSVYEGDIIINKTNLNNLVIPSTLSNSENGFATVKIQNPTNKTVSVILNKPLEVKSLKKIFITFIILIGKLNQ